MEEAINKEQRLQVIDGAIELLMDNELDEWFMCNVLYQSSKLQEIKLDLHFTLFVKHYFPELFSIKYKGIGVWESAIINDEELNLEYNGFQNPSYKYNPLMLEVKNNRIKVLEYLKTILSD